MTAVPQAAVAVVAACMPTSCSRSVSHQGAADLVADVQQGVPGTQAFTDDELHSTAANICTLRTACE
jgi:hypothetical protein